MRICINVMFSELRQTVLNRHRIIFMTVALVFLSAACSRLPKEVKLAAKERTYENHLGGEQWAYHENWIETDDRSDPFKRCEITSLKYIQLKPDVHEMFGVALPVRDQWLVWIESKEHYKSCNTCKEDEAYVSSAIYQVICYSSGEPCKAGDYKVLQVGNSNNLKYEEASSMWEDLKAKTKKAEAKSD
jgi:hypothetical protein